MLYSIFSLIINIISILCFFVLIMDFNGGVSNRFLKGKPILKTIKLFAPFLCILSLYVMGTIYYHKSGNQLENSIPIEIYDLLCASIKSLVFEVRSEKVLLLVENNLLYNLSWWIAYPLCVLTSYISILNSIFHRFSNKQHVKEALRNSCDILIGADFADIYKQQTNTNLILWLDEEITKEKELELIKLGIPYINKTFNVKNLLTIPYLDKTIKRRIRTLKKELKYYIKKSSDFVDYLVLLITKNISEVLIKVNPDINILNKIYKNVDMIYHYTESDELKHILIYLRRTDNVSDRNKVLNVLQNYLIKEEFRLNLRNQIKAYFKGILKIKDYNLMIETHEKINHESKGTLLKLLKEKFPYDINEDKEIDYHFISFKEEEINLKYLSEFKQFLEVNKFNLSIYQTRNYFLHIELSNNNLLSIQNKIQEDANDLSPYLLFFNRYQLLSIMFNEEYPITKYLPNDFINNFGAITNSSLETKYQLTLNDNLKVNTPYDKNINVIYLGFGRVSKALYNFSVMNNQLVSYCTDQNILPEQRYHNHTINYFAVDKEVFNQEDKNNLFFNNRFDNIRSDLEQKDYYTFPESTSNFYPFNSDINNLETYKSLVKILKYKKEQTHSQIIISLDNDLENIDYALKIVMLLKQENITNYHLFVRLQKENDGLVSLLQDENVSFFGYIKDVFNHDIIVKDNLMRLAKLTNRSYNKMKLSNTNWYKLSPIKQKSNLYASMNIRLKLNMLGFDYIKLTKQDLECLTKEQIKTHQEILVELANKLTSSHDSYKDYLFFKDEKNPTISNILSFQEHSRWNAFYLGFGYIPMKKDDVTIINNNIIKDDNTLKQHICLTTYQDLDLWHQQFAELLTKINNKTYEENLINEQTYQYDYMLINQFEALFNDLDHNLLLLIRK